MNEDQPADPAPTPEAMAKTMRILGLDGPIDEHLTALATMRRVPVRALVACANRIEESGPRLRGLLGRACLGAALSEDDKTLLFRGVYVLGAARDPLTCNPLLRLLRLPSADLDDLLGDAITANLSQIVAGVFDGDHEALFSLIAAPSVDEFVREALIGAATFLTAENRIPRQATHDLLMRFFDDGLAEDGEAAWNAWVMAVVLLGFEDLRDRLGRAFREERVDPTVFGPKEAAELTNDDWGPVTPERLEREGLGYIDDIYAALEWSDHDEPEDRPGPSLTRDPFGVLQPLTNPWRHVGRNDPCPCGSGRKFKKCCLDLDG